MSEIDALLKVTDNVAILALLGWIIYLIRQNNKLVDIIDQKNEVLLKIVDTLRKIKYVLQVDRQGKIEINTFDDTVG